MYKDPFEVISYLDSTISVSLYATNLILNWKKKKKERNMFFSTAKAILENSLYAMRKEEENVVQTDISMIDKTIQSQTEPGFADWRRASIIHCLGIQSFEEKQNNELFRQYKVLNPRISPEIMMKISLTSKSYFRDQVQDGIKSYFNELLAITKEVKTIVTGKSGLKTMQEAFAEEQMDIDLFFTNPNRINIGEFFGIPLQGRVQETDQVKNWLLTPSLPLLMIYEVGGAGKTRFALEVARRENPIRPVFFQKEEFSKTDQDLLDDLSRSFSPDITPLLIIDYASSRSDLLQILRFAKEHDKIKFIIMDRFWNKSSIQEKLDQIGLYKNRQYQELKLEPLSYAELHKISEFISGKELPIGKMEYEAIVGALPVMAVLLGFHYRMDGKTGADAAKKMNRDEFLKSRCRLIKEKLTKRNLTDNLVESVILGGLTSEQMEQGKYDALRNMGIYSYKDPDTVVICLKPDRLQEAFIWNNFLYHDDYTENELKSKARDFFKKYLKKHIKKGRVEPYSFLERILEYDKNHPAAGELFDQTICSMNINLARLRDENWLLYTYAFIQKIEELSYANFENYVKYLETLSKREFSIKSIEKITKVFSISYNLLDKGKWKKLARALLESVVDIQIELFIDSTTHNNLAKLLTDHFNNHDNARKHYEQALRIEPNFTQAHYNLSFLLKNHFQDYDNSKKHLEQAMSIDPNNAGAHNNLAVLLDDHFHDYDNSKKHYEQALRIDPNYAIAHNNLAKLLTDHFNNHDKAREHYEQALRIDPNFAQAHYNFAILLTEHFQEHDKAKRHALCAWILRKTFPNRGAGIFVFFLKTEIPFPCIFYIEICKDEFLKTNYPDITKLCEEFLIKEKHTLTDFGKALFDEDLDKIKLLIAEQTDVKDSLKEFCERLRGFSPFAEKLEKILYP